MNNREKELKRRFNSKIRKEQLCCSKGIREDCECYQEGKAQAEQDEIKFLESLFPSNCASYNDIEKVHRRIAKLKSNNKQIGGKKDENNNKRQC